MHNVEIRKAIADARLKHYEVAAAIGISSCTLSVWLRTELTDERMKRVRAALMSLTSRKDAVE